MKKATGISNRQKLRSILAERALMRRFLRPLIFALLVSVFASNGRSLAQDRPLKKLNWGVTTLSASMWIPWLAKEAKIYEKNGLDVETILLKGSGQTGAALLGGSLFAAPVALPNVMLADLSGADLVNVAHTVSVVSNKLLVKPDIRKIEDLRGKKVATSALGSLGDFVFRYILRKRGMDPSREITWLSVGTNSERLQALAAGTIDAADVTYPSDVQGERLGFRVLIDARKEVVYPSTSIVTRRKTIQEDRDTVMRLVRSHVEGIAYFKTHKEFSLKVLTQYVKTNDPEFLEGSYAQFKQDFISVPYPIMKGLEATYDYVALTRPEIRSHKPEEFMDPSFIAELDKSGFIKKLYDQK
jgi:ABC-type nitrate/sulfonate/bicarbonate transport system substrate-binding protein